MNFIPLNGWPQLKEIPEQLEHFREVYARFAKVNRWYKSIEETELTGNPVIFEKALKLNATALSLEMLPIQSGSGDPSPTNVRPISGRTSVNLGRTGKNLCLGKIAHANVNGSGIIISDSYAMFYGSVKQGVEYTVTTDDASGLVCAFFASVPAVGSTAYNSQRVVQQSMTFTAPIDGYIAFRTNENYEYGQLEEGSSSTAYEPPRTPITITIALGQTVYGGTLDVKTGVLTMTHAIVVYDGSSGQAWSMSSGTGYHQFMISRSSAKDTLNALTDYFQSIDISERGSKMGLVKYTDTNIRIALKDSELLIESAEDWKTWLSTHNLHVCYELATPTTVQLTGEELEMLKGYNLISTDADSLTVKAYTI